MPDLTVQPNSVTEEVAEFKGEAFAPTPIMRMVPQFDSMSDDRTSDVRRILARPKFVERIALDSTAGFATGYTLDHDFINSTFNVDQRFAGSLGIRFTTCFRLVVAASPQIGGRLRCFYNPVAASSTGVINTFKDGNWANSDFTAYTQLPGAELDLEKETAIDYKIPYTHYMDYMPLSGTGETGNDPVCIGTFNIIDYIPIAIPTGASIPFMTVYCWLEDIEVIGARNEQLEATNFSTTSLLESSVTYMSALMSVQVTDNHISVKGSYNPKTGLGVLRATHQNATQDDVDGDTFMEFGTSDPLGTGILTVSGVWYDGDENWPLTGTISVEGPEKSVVYKATFELQGDYFTLLFLPTVSESQSGVMQKLEEDISNDGPLSGPLYKMGQAANLIGSAIPILSSVTQPLSWATRISSNLAAAFGYSRPVDLERNTRIWFSQNHYQNNADGPDTSFNMGLLQDNKVCVSDNSGGTNVDEMSLAYITQKPAAIARFQLSTTYKGKIYELGLCPDAMFGNSFVHTAGASQPPISWLSTPPTGFEAFGEGIQVSPSPLFWLGTMFNKFRGGFRFRIKTNKTRFHGGRLLLVFTPYSFQDPLAQTLYSPNLNNGTEDSADLYSHSKVWDLRECSEIEFDCPYIAFTPYLATNVPYGTLSVHVIDNINAPANVTDKLDFVLEVSGMENFEFAFPYQKQWIPSPTIDLRSEDPNIPVITSEIESQSGFVLDTADRSCECIGEKVMSLKQMISRAEWWSLDQLRNVPDVFATLLKGMREYPFFLTRSLWGTTSGPVYETQGYVKPSTQALIVPAYAFARGGSCYDVLTPFESRSLFSYADVTNASGGIIGSGSQIWEEGITSKAKAPFYSSTKKLPTQPAIYNISPTDTSKQSYTAIRWGMDLAYPFVYGANDTFVSKRAADDAQLAFFMCAPKIMYTGDATFTRAGVKGLGPFDQDKLTLQFL